MPPKSKIYALPEPIRAWLDETLAANGGQQFKRLEEELAKKGYLITDSSLQRYHANDLEPRLKALKLATESARTVAAAMGENDGTMLEALTGLCQERLFNILIELGPDSESIKNYDLAKMARAISNLARASIDVKKFVADARKKALADAADAVEKAAKQQGLNAEQAAFWRNQVLGVGL